MTQFSGKKCQTCGQQAECAYFDFNDWVHRLPDADSKQQIPVKYFCREHEPYGLLCDKR